MNNNKWKAVDWSALKPGDTIRVLHENGDVIHGTFHEEDTLSYLKSSFGRFFVASNLAGNGFRFERAVPERTVPTEPGLYTTVSTWPPATLGYDLYIRESGYDEWVAQVDGDQWDEIDPDGLPDDLVRLVPVTEADELRKRLERIRTAVERGTLALAGSGNRDYLLALLDGEA